MGTVIQNTIANVESCCSTSPLVMMIPHEMTLNGDPAIKLNQYDEPDYNIEAQNVGFSPNVVSTSVDSFSVDLEIYNLGKAINENINNLFAVGTTSLRVLESCYSENKINFSSDQEVGSTDIFLYPGKKIESVKGLIIVHPITKIGKQLNLEVMTGFSPIKF